MQLFDKIIISIYNMLIYIFYWKSFREVSTLLLAYLNWPLNESYGKKSFLDPVSEPLKGLCVLEAVQVPGSLQPTLSNVELTSVACTAKQEMLGFAQIG